LSSAGAAISKTRPRSTSTVASWVLYLPLLLAALAAFSWVLNSQLIRLFALTAPSWDLGQSQQLLWSLSHGHGWTSSYEYDHNFLGIHIEPILLLVAAVEWIWPTPVVPLVISALGFAAIPPAAFLMFRALLPEHPGRLWLALALALPMPLWPAIQGAAADQFHPENLALALAMLAAWAGLTGRRVWLWLLVVLTLSCKEDQTFTAFVIGLLLWKAGPQAMRVEGRRVMLLAVAWLLVGVGIQMALRGGGESPDLAYYWWVFLPGPNYFVQAVLRPDAWLMVGATLIGLLGLPLFAPRWLLLVIPPLAASLLSSHEAQERLQLHYALLILFPLVVAAGLGARRVLERLPARMQGPALMAGMLPALAVGLLMGALPPGLAATQWLYSRPPAADRLLAAAAVIPPGAPVYADDGAAVLLASRPEIQTIPVEPAPDRWVVIDRLDWYHHEQPAVAAAESERMAASGRTLLVDDGRFQVWSPAGR
jgi:uncharacterized membrane protein